MGWPKCYVVQRITHDLELVRKGDCPTKLPRHLETIVTYGSFDDEVKRRVRDVRGCLAVPNQCELEKALEELLDALRQQ